MLDDLRQASDGLLFPSESDRPFVPTARPDLSGVDLSDDEVRAWANRPDGSPVERVELDYLFRNTAFEKEWHDDVQKANVERFANLIAVLRDRLGDVRAYRVGRIEVAILIAGRAPDGTWAGLLTEAIET